MNENETTPLKAVLVGIQLQRTSDQELKGSLTELSRLVTTLGYEVVGQMSQRRSSTKTANVLGDGKLKELAQWTGGTGKVSPNFVKKKHKAALRFKKDEEEDDLFGDDVEEVFEVEDGAEDMDSSGDTTPQEKAQVVVIDCDLSPSQLRNLESATGAQVLDRTGVIIEIFSRHARTRAARLQVEIARLTYVAPRMRESTAGDDRQGGGGKGAGETSIELDRRKIRDRIKELKQELASISQELDTRRARREQELTIALVGYTNAGKSSLMRALTGSDVLVADKLFATLDTTVRVLYPETRPKMLVSDTVGFIKKLPHDLVASFKSTLDEAANASLLLYTVDCSDPTFRSQLEVTRTVLAEVGAQDIPSMLIFNKRDRLSQEEEAELAKEFPEAHFMSAKNPDDIAALHTKLVQHFENAMVEEDVLIPYTTQGAIGDIRAKMRVLSENYEANGVMLKVRARKEDLEQIKERFGLTPGKGKKKKLSWNIDEE
ncbi:GTPase HflX [Bdellovibrio bacteriovorus]|uniref:GTPase HflX n=1 Tax=Bdellovibrio bacteriovorus TaxID=959 RepID=UPI003A809A41